MQMYAHPYLANPPYTGMYVCYFLLRLSPFRVTGSSRETLTTVLGASTQGATAVLVGTSAGGVAAFNVASWLLDTFDQAKHS